MKKQQHAERPTADTTAQQKVKPGIASTTDPLRGWLGISEETTPRSAASRTDGDGVASAGISKFWRTTSNAY